MSHLAVLQTWERADIKDPIELLVMLAIADLSDGRGPVSCSVASLAKRCRMSEPSVRKVVARLKATGLLGSRLKASFRESAEEDGS